MEQIRDLESSIAFIKDNEQILDLKMSQLRRENEILQKMYEEKLGRVKEYEGCFEGGKVDDELYRLEGQFRGLVQTLDSLGISLEADQSTLGYLRSEEISQLTQCQ